MPFDQQTRNRLQKFVTESRSLLSRDFTRQLQNDHGMDPESGHISALDKLTRLDPGRLETARLLREMLEHRAVANPTAGTRAALDRIVREQAFTVLNRLCALRMAEARGILFESIGKAYRSKGFQLYHRLAGSAHGEIGDAYRCFLFSLFDEFAADLPVLFDRYSPMGRLFPRESTLLDLFDRINHPEIAPLWAEDEAIGWIYQYFNSAEERREMRAQSQAPRNSRELAVRNQFFTPRYVVEFLTDNTLGRLWREMTRGNTALDETCRYRVRRPNENFLARGERPAPDLAAEALDQEALLNQPVHIPHRPLKDPREIRVIDPACGSMHFGLYAFDLFETIYSEAWDMAQTGEIPDGADPSFADFQRHVTDYASKEEYLKEVPRLIIERNIHGVEIDARAAQIAGLSLWLRAQRAWQERAVPFRDRPRIRKSNIVRAEPMPGEKEMLKEFTGGLKPRVLGKLVEIIFEKMALAGEAGSLLRIEKEIEEALVLAREEYSRRLVERKHKVGKAQPLPGFGEFEQKETFDFSDLPGKTDFWETARQSILDALEEYAAHAEATDASRKRLFAEDAARGFAFIDICLKRFDAALMNPPFGEASLPTKSYMNATYLDTKGDVYKAFVECFQDRLEPGGFLGIISNRTGFFLTGSTDWRERIVLRLYKPLFLADFGHGVLDALVETAAYVLRSLTKEEDRRLTASLMHDLNRVKTDDTGWFSVPKYVKARGRGIKRHQAITELERLKEYGCIEEPKRSAFRKFKTTTYNPLDDTSNADENQSEMICFRLMKVAEKASLLHSLVSQPNQPGTFVVRPKSFRIMPNSPFSYWCGEKVRRIFKHLKNSNEKKIQARRGPSSGDDFRRIRCWWEIGAKIKHGFGTWIPFSKGGVYSRYYADIYLMVEWEPRRNTFMGFFGRPGRWIERPESLGFFFRQGLTWPRRTSSGISLRVLPKGCIFADKGPAAFVPGDRAKQLLALLCFMNSAPFEALIAFQLAAADTAARSYEVGIIQRTPIPDFSEKKYQSLSNAAHNAWSLKRGLDTIEETSHVFHLPALFQVSGEMLNDRAKEWSFHVMGVEEKLSTIQSDVDAQALDAYGLEPSDLYSDDDENETTAGDAGTNDDEPSDGPDPKYTAGLTAGLISWAMGAALGRFDVQFATGDRPIPREPEPFAPLPPCSPGMLLGPEGLPAEPGDVPDDYSLRISWGGVLVDDEGHSEDITARVREVIEVVWEDGAGEIEREIREILGVRATRDYFAKPARFFADHLKRYSKSRRNAPIYWPLSTATGAYTLWLYYPRLTDQTLYTCVNDFVEPKLTWASARANEQRRATDRSRRDEKKLEKFANLEADLEDFREELLRVAEFWKPDLNDGVQITAAPLWRLFRHKPWQKKLKQTWEKLKKGDYDWSHLARAVWPDRVIRKCHEDRSLAIAHDVEDELWVEKKVVGGGRGGKEKVVWEPRAK